MGRRKVSAAALRARGSKSSIAQAEQTAPLEHELDGAASVIGLGSPPKHLSAEEKLVWAQVAVDNPDLAGAKDRIQVEQLCILVAHQRKLKAKFGKYRDIMNLLDRLGMTPMGRAMMAVKIKQNGGPIGDAGSGGAPVPQKTGFGSLRGEE